jgi:formylglycine-generating enzyme required for sulfatase activity
MEDEKKGMPHEVGQKEPNAFGLYDTYGNVSEWCWDCYGEAFYRQSPVADPVGPITVGRRVLRGGSCFNGSFRSAHRVPCGPQHRNIDIGFRVARTQM